jgi:hypothetical protein
MCSALIVIFLPPAGCCPAPQRQKTDGFPEGNPSAVYCRNRNLQILGFLVELGGDFEDLFWSIVWRKT